jgi:Fe-S-cluster-containing dehydrogenase component/anaerobic selenocysteine-containing dehydrogenase
MRPPTDPTFVPLTALSAYPKQWRSLEEWRQETGAVDSGVTAHEPEFTNENRREFLRLMSASLALAGMTACTRQPTELIVPYVDPPEQTIPGHPRYYATAVAVNGVAQGVIVETHLGRPTKVEGNPDHPASLGATSVVSQASVLDLYDPDRAKEITYRGDPRSWEDFLLALQSMLAPLQGSGEGLHILTETVTSPSIGAQMEAVLAQFPGARWHQWDAAGLHSAWAGGRMAFGRPVNAYYRLADADVVVALDSDFLTCGPASTRYARDFMDRRRRAERMDMNRLYSVESSMTSTGGKADHRLPLRYSEIEGFARAVAGKLGVANAATNASETHYAQWPDAVAQDLAAHRGSSAVIPGDWQSPAVHVLAHQINATLGNIGKTVIHTAPLEVQPVDQIESLRDLVNALDSGSVNVLLILGGNPVYNAPADFAFAQMLGRAKNTIHVASHHNETSAYCQWHVPESHVFEDWGDARSFDGTVTIMQPLIYPLYRSRSHVEVLDAFVNQPGRTSLEIVTVYWASKQPARDFDPWWRQSLHDGFIAGSALPAITASISSSVPAASAKPAGGLEFNFRPDPYVHDGRYSNLGWLMELPRPMTKLAWDNAVLLSPRTAERLGFPNQQRVTLQRGATRVEASVWIQPGHPDESATVHLGFGRSRAGSVGNNTGFNAYLLRTSDALWSTAGLELTKSAPHYPLATTQTHQSMDGRPVAISADVEHYRQNPDFVKALENAPERGDSLYPPWSYTGYAWGMSIDLTACVGCNACVAACQAENNIPVVGKGQVLAAREMHWLRIDTYYEGAPENPSVHFQPVPCMQCENAPCELVCPVHATVHSADGLNDMTYNRCVGTRYCSNNCPYKVRRFNFFLYQDWYTETLKLQRNPNVTARSRGVMEKCTYCVQRIREAEIRSKIEDRAIRDGEIQTACQQACPTQAIVFGDINQRANRVSQRKAEKLNYALLAELNTRPRTTYLAELRNPNPALASEHGG